MGLIREEPLLRTYYCCCCCCCYLIYVCVQPSRHPTSDRVLGTGRRRISLYTETDSGLIGLILSSASQLPTLGLLVSLSNQSLATPTCRFVLSSIGLLGRFVRQSCRLVSCRLALNPGHHFPPFTGQRKSCSRWRTPPVVCVPSSGISRYLAIYRRAQ